MTALRCIVGLVVVLAVGGCAGPDRAEPRQAILILLDAARPDRFSAYGYARQTTPNIDQLAREGLLFTAFFAQGTHTREALPALFYSRYFMPPLFFEITGVPYAAPEELFQRADAEAVSLPRMLSAAGIRTAALSAHSWVAEHSPLAAEFDEFQDLSTRLTYPKRQFFPPADQVVGAAIAWLARHRDEDYFLYLHVMDTHTPHYFEDDARRWFSDPDFRADAFDELGRPIDTSTALDGANRAYLDALYDGDLHDVDRQLGRLFAWLRAAGAWERTVVIVTADHGEALLEQPGRFGHGGEWFDDVGRIPFILHHPRRVRPGRVDTFGEQVDVAPTLLGLLGVPVPPGKRLDGVDLLHGAPAKAYAVMSRGIRSTRYKALFRRPDALFASPAALPAGGEVKLFDLEHDPGETRDVHAVRPAELAALVGQFRAALGARHARFTQARARDAPPGAFAIASAWFTTRPTVASLETSYARPVLARLGPAGWIQAAKGVKSALVARGAAPALEIEFPVPDGTYAVTLGMRGACRITLGDGTGREATGAPIDLDATPGALWKVRPVPLGPLAVTGGRFRATVTPTTSAFVLRWVGFAPPDRAGRPDDVEQRERVERLRGLGYVE